MDDPAIRAAAFVDWTAGDIAENLAADEALLLEAEERRGLAVLRAWEPSTYAVVLGASRRLREEVRVEACRADGVPIARRSSGGGTVVVGPGCLNVTVVLPIAAGPPLAAVDTAQAFVLGRIARAIAALGPPVELLGSGDLTVDGRKFAGSAQRRLREHLMVHASILINMDLTRIERYLHPPKRQPAYRANRPHGAFVANLGLPTPRVLKAIREAWVPGPIDRLRAVVPADRVAALVRERFGDPSWVERL